jgi:Pyruvate/2-oxoacid:ferredoxin oxidoreductase gamma subunit
MKTGADFILELEAMGEERVRADFVGGGYKILSREREVVREWLAAKDAARATARDEESLSISRKALSASIAARDEARRANRLAINAIIIAIMAIVLPIAIMWAHKKWPNHWW